ncbi:hypothetical protein ACSQ67_025346 [Phaseolus vulgaris]
MTSSSSSRLSFRKAPTTITTLPSSKQDFLVFRYDGVNEFRVTIFEISTHCEKTLINIEEEEGNEEEKAAAQVEETVIRQKEQAEDCDIEDEEDSQDQHYDDDNNDSDFDDEEDENTEMEEESEGENSVGPVGYTSQNIIPNLAEGTLHQVPTPRLKTLSKTMNLILKCAFSQKIIILKQNSKELDPTNCIFQVSPFKTFPLVFLKRLPLNVANTASVRYSSVHSLSPQDIQRNQLQDYHLNLAQLVPIRKKYLEVTGKVCRWNNDRICIGGWANFSRRNKIKNNDVCICEVILGEDQVVRTFLVHVGTRRE